LFTGNNNNEPPVQRIPSGMQTATLVFAALYWLSPLDLIPFIPIDDVIVVILALILFNALGGRD
jgi:uncharacterized membrane protein YkvA (DUF1232 family)